MPQLKVCFWDKKGPGCFSTECGEHYKTADIGSLVGVKYCGFCGGVIRVTGKGTQHARAARLAELSKSITTSWEQMVNEIEELRRELDGSSVS